VRSTNTPQFRGFYAIESFLRFPEFGLMTTSSMRFDAPPVVESSFEKRESVGYGKGSERTGRERGEL
jgi:hypothetical protein